MNEKLHVYDYPEFLKSDEFIFDIKEVLRNSLYYPGSYTDGTLVKEFRGNFHSFVHVDYHLSKEDFETALVKYPFRNFDVIYKESLDAREIVPTAFNSEHSNSFGDDCAPFCEWVIFENSSGVRFSLLQICAEGVESYLDLYVKNRINAEAVAIIKTDGFSGNWTHFSTGPFLKRSVTKSGLSSPKYLFCDREHFWNDYTKHIDIFKSSEGYDVDISEYEVSKKLLKGYRNNG